VIEALDAEEARVRGDEQKVRDEILGLLEARQKARFILFTHEFRRRVEGQLQAARGRRMDAGGPPARGPAPRNRPEAGRPRP
jgi:hypothetical protein